MKNPLASNLLSFTVQKVVPSSSFTVRKTLLRTILICSLFSFMINMIFGVQLAFKVNDDDSDAHAVTATVSMALTILPIILSVHHVLRLWPRKKWSVKSDFIYSTVELGLATGYLIAERIVFDGYGGAAVLGIIAVVILWLSIVSSFLLTVWNLHTSHYRAMGSTYNFMEDYDGMVAGRKGSRISRWSLLFGANICRRRFGIDRMFVRGLRGGISILSFLGMFMFGYVILSTQPITPDVFHQEMEMTDLGYTGGNVTLYVDLQIKTENFEEYKLLHSKLIDWDITWQPNSRQASCDIDDMYATCNVQSPFSDFSPDNLIITVDYTRALQYFSLSSLRTGIYLAFGTDAVGYGLIGNIPTQLFPGFHLFGTTFYSYRDTYASSRDLTLRIPRFVRQLVTNVQALIPDPEVASSNASNTTATLRLTYQGGSTAVQSGYTVQRDQPGSTVFNSFALLGGIWTFINGAFAMIFGCRLLLVLFGIKPLSIYGLVHLFQRRRPHIDSGYTLSAEEQNRTIAILREHLLDDDDGDIEAGKASMGRDQDVERVVGGNTPYAGEQSRNNVALQELLLGDANGNGKGGESPEGKDQDVE